MHYFENYIDYFEAQNTVRISTLFNTHKISKHLQKSYCSYSYGLLIYKTEVSSNVLTRMLFYCITSLSNTKGGDMRLQSAADASGRTAILILTGRRAADIRK